jgi:hypothetical protein
MVLSGAALVALLLGTWAVVAGLSARTDLLAAQRLLSSVSELPEDLDAVAALLDDASLRTTRAREGLAAPGPAIVGAVPLLGRSLSAERDVAETADALVQAGRRSIPVLHDVGAVGAKVDAAALGRLSVALDQAAARVRGPAARLAQTPTAYTPAAVGSAVAEARAALLPAAEALDRAASGVRALRGLLGADRPRTLVVGVMNNAEARGAGGYVPSFAVVTVQAGSVEVSPFTDVNTVQDEPAQARRVPAPEDYSARWGRYLADTTLWKNVAMSPHDPDSLRVLCEVARTDLGVPCDGAVLLDVPALAAIMTLSGPVQLEDRPVEGAELVEALLVDAYADTEDLDRSQADRRAVLLAAADTALSDLLGDGLTGLPALRALATAAAGRHLAVWSAVASEQADLVAAGVAGSVDPRGGDLSLVSLNQLSAGKLDYYLRREQAVSVVVGRHSAEVEQRVRFTLDHPPDLPAYVLGVRGGRLDELVDLGLSTSATDVVLERDGQVQPFALVAEDSGSARVQVDLLLTAPVSTELVLRYRVPVEDGAYRLELRPQPLARDASLRLSVTAEAGLDLTGIPVADGRVRQSGPLSSSRTVQVRAERPSWFERPVSLPW